AAMGIAPELEELAAYAERLGLKRHEPGANGGIASPVVVNCRELRDSGYVRLESAGAVALLDVGPVGPDYLPGHAHADTLSFECSIFGRRVIVNGGTSRYGGGKEFTDRRLFERSTRNHSTVEIAGESSSEVWGSFRVARRAYPMDLAVRCAAESVLVDCSHDGYRRLPGHPVHRRVWLMEARRLSVEDWVSGELPAVARFILHPDVRVERQANNRLVLTVGGGDSVSLLVVEGGLSLQQVHCASCFGVLRETACVEIALVSGRCAVSLEW
ncbi:MAG: heparinase, partial [Methylococcus sp.]